VRGIEDGGPPADAGGGVPQRAVDLVGRAGRDGQRGAGHARVAVRGVGVADTRGDARGRHPSTPVAQRGAEQTRHGPRGAARARLRCGRVGGVRAHGRDARRAVWGQSADGTLGAQESRLLDAGLARDARRVLWQKGVIVDGPQGVDRQCEEARVAPHATDGVCGGRQQEERGRWGGAGRAGAVVPGLAGRAEAAKRRRVAARGARKVVGATAIRVGPHGRFALIEALAAGGVAS
jgi:hypothetical protein